MDIASFIAGLLIGICLIGFLLYLIKRKNPPPKRIRGYLDLIPSLTEEQKEKLEEIRKVFLPRVGQIREDLRRRRRVLADLLFSDIANKKAILREMEEIAALQIKLEEEVINHILEEKILLTPEQQEQFYHIILDQFRGGGLGVHGAGGKWEKGKE